MPTFFVRESEKSLYDRWYKVWLLATRSRNLTIDLLNVPDYAMDWFFEWHKQDSAEPAPFDPASLDEF